MDKKEKLDLADDEDQKLEKQTTAYDVEMRKLDIREEKAKKADEFKKKNKYKLISLGLGILTILSLFDYGFFKTLGIWIVLGFCYLLGGWYDKDSKIIRFLMNLLNKFQ